MQIRKIILRGGSEVEDATIDFAAGANILAGQSDTGKSYLFHCIDYILGADEFKKNIPIAEPYSQLYVEFENSEKNSITLERNLSGGGVVVYYCKFEEITEVGEKIATRRSGKGQSKDITSVLLPFSGMKDEAKLRKNDNGDVQRLTVRTLLPVFMVNEVAMIDEKSPVVGDGTFDATARKRMFSYLISGKDDTGIIATEHRDIVITRNRARLSLIEDMLEPLENKVQDFNDDPEETIEKIESAIQNVYSELTKTTSEREGVLESLKKETAELQRAETQLIAIEEVLLRYNLLDKRYESDLSRLDFIAEGVHYFTSLQEVNCPLCEQKMDEEHVHGVGQNSADIYEGARAEASKIKALKIDLIDAIHTLEERLLRWKKKVKSNRDNIKEYESYLNEILSSNLSELNNRLKKLIQRRITLEGIRNDREQLNSLKLMKEDIEKSTTNKTSKVSKWEPLPTVALRTLCKSIEDVLKSWCWGEDPRVEFDHKLYDIVVDGQSRQSHGKGVRSILYSAFVIGLLLYSVKQGKPHPGFVILDSPLTSYRKSPSIGQQDTAVSASIETGFWASLKELSAEVQVIVIENKEPLSDVVKAVHYEWFAGDTAQAGQRVGFIPLRQ
ncbi:hypothetical protein [Escherichia coli]|uniref:hypothetical protein n=1 Tax=Escherichia coli TaxID=562 RepID=UPI002E7710F7|nr:hypothetical protein [Escherichia coli]MEE1586906.1 hypothetical protein [Escherichia coli]MEE1591351.1 hypothetical protein [Escherichia coli]